MRLGKAAAISVFSFFACSAPCLADSNSDLIAAAASGDASLIRSLLEAGADVNAKDDGGWTALMETARNGRSEAAKILLEQGASVNARDHQGMTALMHAAMKGKTSVARLLVEKGANVTLKNKQGITAVVFAANRGHADTAKVLRRLTEDAAAKEDAARSEAAAQKAAQEAQARQAEEALIAAREEELLRKRAARADAARVAAERAEAARASAARTEQELRRQAATALVGAFGALVAALGLGVWLYRRRSAPPAAEPAGASRLGGTYELLRLIGEGGMGLVYEGRDAKLDRPVVVKRMRADFKLHARERTRFIEEARISALLRHPLIVEILAVIEEAGEIFIVVERVEGKTLEQAMDGVERASFAQIAPLLKHVCQALAYAHSQRVAHRDLKPSNIILTSQGVAKVADFGIERQLLDTMSRLTKTNWTGSLAYLAPEQELGRFDSRSDIFSLGAVAYELLAGDLPFPGPNFLAQKERMTFKPLGQAAADIPTLVAAAVERCLRFEPKDRFQTVEEFARAAGLV